MNPQTKVLSQIATANETSKNVFEVFSNRERFRKETNLPRLQRTLLEAGKKVVDDEFISLFSKLQDAGVGSLIAGRGNKLTRFKWHYNLKDVAKSVKHNVQVPITAKLDQPKRKRRSQAEMAKADQTLLKLAPVVMTTEQLQELVKRIVAELSQKDPVKQI